MPWFLVVLVVFVTACKSDVDKLLDAHGDKVKAQLTKIAALEPIVAKEAKLAEDHWPVAGAKLPGNSYQDASGNTMWSWSHQLVDPCTHRFTTYAKDNEGMEFIIMADSRISTTSADTATMYAKCAVDGKDSGGFDEKQALYLERVTYVIVLRPEIKQAPELDRGEVMKDTDAYLKGEKGPGVSHFVPGRLAGDALVYELATAKLAGGFRFDVTSSESVSTRGAGIDEIRRDLSSNLEKFLVAKFAN